MSLSQNNRDQIMTLHHLWNSGDLDRIPEIYAQNFVAHMPKGWEKSEFAGFDGIREAILRVRNAFSDWREDVRDIIVEGDKVVTRYRSTGTHTGQFLGLEPTGRKIVIDEISIYHLRDHRVVEQWCLTDDLSLAKQLGLLGAAETST